jgi:hypothetical protein
MRRFLSQTFTLDPVDLFLVALITMIGAASLTGLLVLQLFEGQP